MGTILECCAHVNSSWLLGGAVFRDNHKTNGGRFWHQWFKLLRGRFTVNQVWVKSDQTNTFVLCLRVITILRRRTMLNPLRVGGILRDLHGYCKGAHNNGSLKLLLGSRDPRTSHLSARDVPGVSCRRVLRSFMARMTRSRQRAKQSKPGELRAPIRDS